ncbi:uncharacterized protein Dere_GG26270 [Drosophila erecta]|uniref:Uncharacterized protein n=2 Tax=Drosophila erecta TaxID=7220 RepID=A0A0Q5W9P8_DROER|nr:uncharacterized protein Dere_GG26270 [Drosophila erecta]
MYLTRPNYTTPYKSQCIGCGAEVPVSSILGCHFKVPQNKDLDKPHSCGLQDFTAASSTSSKRASSHQHHRQLRKHRNGSRRRLINYFKWTPSCTQKRANPDVTKLLQPKRKSAKSSEPFYKAVILREMIRLGRQPNRKFERAARKANSLQEW